VKNSIFLKASGKASWQTQKKRDFLSCYDQKQDSLHKEFLYLVWKHFHRKSLQEQMKTLFLFFFLCHPSPKKAPEIRSDEFLLCEFDPIIAQMLQSRKYRKCNGITLYYEQGEKSKDTFRLERKQKELWKISSKVLKQEVLLSLANGYLQIQHPPSGSPAESNPSDSTFIRRAWQWDYQNNKLHSFFRSYTKDRLLGTYCMEDSNLHHLPFHVAFSQVDTCTYHTVIYTPGIQEHFYIPISALQVPKENTKMIYWYLRLNGCEEGSPWRPYSEIQCRMDEKGRVKSIQIIHLEDKSLLHQIRFKYD